MKRAARLALFLGVTILLGACQSGSSASQTSAQQVPFEQIVENIKQKLKKDYPGIDVQGVKTVEGFPGLYEVQIEGDLVYMDPTAKYALLGHLIDVKTKADLTEKALEKQAQQSMKKLPYQHAIKEVRGDGKRTLILFSDPDCPFCKKIEQSLQELDNVTIYTFMAPIKELHPDAARKAEAIWCAENRLKAWNGFMRQGEPLPEMKASCNAPKAEWAKLMKKFKIHATPTLLFPNGKVVPGAMAKEDIEKVLEQIESKDKAKKDEVQKKDE